MKFKTRLLYILIFLSGVSGLVYQIVWQRYLSILLGAHARANAIVLAVFLGGLAIGYAWFGRWSRRTKKDLVKTYALIEIALACWAIAFPFLFHIAMQVSGWLYGLFGITSILTDLLLSIGLIGVPTFLMGSTLPVLTQGMSQTLNRSSRVHARIYGLNTLGACLGSFLTGYLLIPETSFQIALVVGAVINLVVGGLLFAVRFEKITKLKNVEISPKVVSSSIRTKSVQILLCIGFLSGFSLIALENALIRLMGLAAGASHYNFSMVVTIFIMGLGLGSLWFRDSRKFSEQKLLFNLSTLTILWCLELFLIRSWPYHVHVLRAGMNNVHQAFYVYQILLGIYFALGLFVPVALSGMTLPLCFHLIKDRSDQIGYRIGQLYSLNTFGCVLGAVFGGYYVLNFINLDQVLKLCIFLFLVSAILAFVLYVKVHKPSVRIVTFSIVTLILTVSTLALFPRFPTEMWIQPFRNQAQLEVTLNGEHAFRDYLGQVTKIVYWKDGANTSLGIGATPKDRAEESRSIFVNGKSDGNTRGDYFTTVMLAHLPALMARNIENIAVIGFGTGITIGTLSLYPETKQIHVLEISDTIIKNAFQFDAYNGGVSKHPKVQFHEMDAFRYFNGKKSTFDLIVSEPSNPWVMGIENLYSTEFYKIAKEKLSEEGVFAQWIHTYSFSDELLRMVLKTLSGVFPYVSMFQLKGGDLVLMAKRSPFDEGMFGRVLQRMGQSEIKVSLQTAGISNIESLLALEIAPPSTLRIMAQSGREHRLTSPKLSHESARAFFLGTSANPQLARRANVGWASGLQESLLVNYHTKKLVGSNGKLNYSPQVLEEMRSTFCDNSTSKNTRLCEEVIFASRYFDGGFRPHEKYSDILPGRVLASVDSSEIKRDQKFDQMELGTLNSFFETYKEYASPVTYIEPKSFYGRLDLCLQKTSRKDSLFGQCLLQKLVMMESIERDRTLFGELALQYIVWVDGFPAQNPDHPKLMAAANILKEMIGIHTQQKPQ